LNIIEAFEYYDKHINRQERFKLLLIHKLRVPGSIHSIDWELFGSILTGDIGKYGYGSDLTNHEVKSAKEGSAFEYQYHLNTGEIKLRDDKSVEHIFISYSPDYKNVVVRKVAGYELADIFASWEEGLRANYTGSTRKQRFRRSISYQTIVKKGEIVMQIKNCQLIVSG